MIMKQQTEVVRPKLVKQNRYFDKVGENQPKICVTIQYQHCIQTAPIIEYHHLLVSTIPTTQGTYHVI